MTPSTIHNFILKRDRVPTDRELKEAEKKRKKRMKEIRLTKNLNAKDEK